MRNQRNRKMIRKRSLSAALAIGLLMATILPNIGFGGNVSKAASDLDYYYAPTVSGSATRAVRGVLDSIDDLPQKKYESLHGIGMWKNLNMGTVDRPFTILEIVPYEEYAHIGYLIAGCEPTRLEELTGTIDASFNWGSITTATGGDIPGALWNDFDNKVGVYYQANQKEAYYFPDEQKGNLNFYSAENRSNVSTKTDIKEFKGYYEFVGDGKGKFSIDTTTNKIIRVPSGNISWHTINEFDEEVFKKKDIIFSYASVNADLPAGALRNLGDKYYTYRKSGSTDPYVYVPSYVNHYYANKDSFVTDVIGLPKKQADTYSVVVKTITPSELNSQPNWVDYADLIYITPKTHDNVYISLWCSKGADGEYANRLKKSPTASSYTDGFTNKDISYDVMKKLFDRATATENYAAVVFDMTIKDNMVGDTKACEYKIIDYNFKNSQKVSYETKQTKDRWGRVTKTETITNYTDRVFNGTGYLYNMAKLWLMLTSENPNIINKMFWNGGKISKGSDGKAVISTQTGDAAKYWDEVIFMLVDPDIDQTADTNTIMNNDDYWWTAYKATDNSTQEKYLNYAFSHTYTFKGDKALTQSFIREHANVDNAWFNEFNDYVKNDPDTRSIWEANFKGQNYDSVVGNKGEYSKNIPPSAAIRYILNLGNYQTPYFGGKLNVLNIEPLAGLDTNYNPIWKENEIKNMVQMLLPNYTGSNADISVTSMNMPTFVGKTDDLSTYDLIYFGNDIGGYWSKSDGTSDFYDDTMDGWIYFHMGDKLTGGKQRNGNTRTGKFLDGVNDETLRFPGNDITHVMTRKLKDYMEAGHPVVVHNELFNNDRMDPSSYMKAFINEQYVAESVSKFGTGNKRLFKKDEPHRVEENVRDSRIYVTFTHIPPSYDESTYLPLNSQGKAIMEFSVTVDRANAYSYNLYVDQDRNAKFDSSEKVYDSLPIIGLSYDLIPYKITDKMVGFVQWRLEVYRNDNHKLMKAIEGGSAIKQKAGKEKTKINVLQIIPDGKTNCVPEYGNLTADLSSSAYSSLYNNLDAFEIEVKTIEFKDFNAIFKNAKEQGERFTFNIGGEVSDTNPKLSNLTKLNTLFNAKYGKPLEYYNMIVVGFADAYGGTDLSNEYGVAEYLYYFAAINQSMLFTHDNSSIYNAAGKMGFTANTMMRDIMGMNRYNVSSKFAGTNNTVSADALLAYRNKMLEKEGFEYDKAEFNGSTSIYKQGFTYMTLRKASTNQDASKEKLQYKYMVKDAATSGTTNIQHKHQPQTGAAYYIETPTGFFRDENQNKLEPDGETNLAKRLNVGQITQYPYNISANMPIAGTHAQWYQLNMEDPEVTVWYTLEYDNVSKPESYSKIYAATPQDAANNYYIFSKGNIFYSGVGHSYTQDASNTMERKLFINTMIAAYRPGVQAPEIVVTNSDAYWDDSISAYKLRVPQQADFSNGKDSSDGITMSNEVIGEDYVKVFFRPEDVSLSNNIRVKVTYGTLSNDGINVIDNVYAKSNDAAMNKDGEGFFLELHNATEYYFYFPKSAINSTPCIKFTAYNDKAKTPGETKLRMIAQPLFPLD